MKKNWMLRIIVVMVVSNLIYVPALATQLHAPRRQYSCPCSIWDDTVTPSSSFRNPNSIELGLKFRSDVDGYILGVRFYKDRRNKGVHIGRLWSSQGALLAENVFVNESASGWQSMNFNSPIGITADETYIVSYYTPEYFSYNQTYFSPSGVDKAPLHALANGIDGPNGVFRQGGGFPDQSSNATNYWVDLIFDTTPTLPDTQPPQVVSLIPDEGVSIVRIDANVRAKFSESLRPDTVNAITFELRDPFNNLVDAAVTFDVTTFTAILNPNDQLSYNTTYITTLKGGADGVMDWGGNSLEHDRTWSFTTSAPPPLSSDQGPGGPILIISNTANPFTRYYAEILHAEGLNEFSVVDISDVTLSTLALYDLAILGEMQLTGNQTSLLEDWVTNGGRLIAMRPDKQLASILGISDANSTISNAYVLVDTLNGPGVGIVNQTIQFHGSADLYHLNGASSLAELYSDAFNPTGSPAVALMNVGSNGGKVAVFTYDLARSIVYTRQGNPAWVGQHRNPWQLQYVALDLFYPDWIDFNKIAIPQADEQQRFLANLITQMTLDKKPLPRFWYLPRGEKAVVIMTGDDHNKLGGNSYSGNTAAFFERHKSQSQPGCLVENWECVRSSSYVFAENPMSDAQAAAYTAEGFEIGVHADAALGTSNWCTSWTPNSLFDIHERQLYGFSAKYPSLPIPASERSHCYSWLGYVDQPKMQYDFGIRMDNSVPYWPANWVQNRPGFMLGSGMPMRFADVNGDMINVYQAHTFISDDNGRNGQQLPYTINTLLDWALGPEGYYGAFTINMHSDRYYSYSYTGSDAIVASAQSRGVPIVSARQMLEWLDGRNSSAFSQIIWEPPYLNFQVSVGMGATGLQAMVPVYSHAGEVTEIFLDGVPISFSTQIIKGVNYAIFSAQNGSYVIRYAQNGPTPTPTATATSSQTPSPTSTPTFTPAVTATQTPSPTSTPTLTPAVTATQTPSPTSTPTLTPAVTATQTPSVTPSQTSLVTSTPSPTPTDTPTPSATPTPSNTPTSTATSQVSVIFADGFESGSLSAWTTVATDQGDLSATGLAALSGSYGLQAIIDDVTPIYVRDDTPNSETRYAASFQFDLNSIGMANNDSHMIFRGFSGANTVTLGLWLRFYSGQYQIQVGAFTDASTWRLGNMINLSDSVHNIELDWTASSGTNDGRLSMWVDGVQVTDLSNLDNDTQRIDSIRLGAIAGIDSGTQGTYYFDAFNSRR